MKKYTEEERKAFAESHKHARPDDIIHESVIIKSGARIGEDGFGWVRYSTGELHPMPHAGNVVIEKDVVIGCNTCIDRAVVGSTIIGEGTKIDNLVHIAHGAKIGKHCLIVAGTVIGGSSEIGSYTFIGMNASIKNKVKIGKYVTIGAGAVVLRDVPDGEVWAGCPAKKIEKK